MRTLIISDIHGCSRPLEKLLAVLAPDPAQDRLILLGDLFDRGPDSWEVLQRVKELQRLNVLDCIECGSCAFTCPGKLPLVERFRKGKQMVREASAK